MSRSIILALVLLATAPVHASAASCKPDEIAVPDERDAKKTLCLKKSELEKARKICAANAQPGEKVDPMQCICQDADTVGACGD